MNTRSKAAVIVFATVSLFGFGLEAHSADENQAIAPTQLTEAGRTAPNFVGINQWLNSGPLSMADLRGKVVLVDFWTFGCINCVHTLPHVTKLFNTYKDSGLVVVGVHSPEFPFEKSTSNVEGAIKRFGIRYPVAQDNNFTTWNAYHNEFWPAQYIVDRHGKVVYQHAGEGQYNEMEQTIRKLLQSDS